MINLKTKKIRSKNIKNKINTTKLTIIYTITIFILWIIISNINNIVFFTDILDNKVLITNFDNIKDTSTTWPLKYTTNWWTTTDYEKTKWTEWDLLPEEQKTVFPQKMSDIINQYRYLSPSNVWSNISNPLEREMVLFYKRLITTTWTASYECTSKECKLWTPDTWTHAWIDILSSYKTPVYSIANWIVITVKNPCPWEEDKNACWNWFWNYIAIATNINWEIIASIYWHLNSTRDLNIWDIVKKWDLIWYLWDSWNSTAPHLHFQINRIWKLEEIKNMDIWTQLFTEWFHNMDWVKAKTIDPIAFIEANMVTKNDSFTSTSNVQTAAAIQQTTDSNNNDNSLITEISKQLSSTEEKQEAQKFSSAPEKDFKIVNIKLSKIDTKLTKWDTIKADITTKWTNGAITITTNNDVIKSSQYIINPNWKNKYEISLTANNIWNWNIILDDWATKKTYYFSVYDNSMDVYWLGIEWPDTIYTTIEKSFNIYPIDKLWNKLFTSLEWNFKVILENKNNWEKTTILNYTNKDKKTSISVNVKAADLADYKLKIYFEWNNKSYIANRNLKSDLFLDYSKEKPFANSINQLNKKWIVKWGNWILTPNAQITRAEVITILIRNKYWDDAKKFKTEMNTYIKKKGKFFKDIKWTEWYAPYVYMWFKDWIVKWTKWLSKANETITKAELLTIYGRYFNIWKSETFSNWLDVSDWDWFKEYADSAKKYNLYPFDDLKKFDADEKVIRINAFESLYRYINQSKWLLSIATNSNLSATSSDYTNQLEDVMKKILSN